MPAALPTARHAGFSGSGAECLPISSPPESQPILVRDHKEELLLHWGVQHGAQRPFEPVAGGGAVLRSQPATQAYISPVKVHF